MEGRKMMKAYEDVKNIKYWDNAATTKVDERVLKEMLPYFDQIYGNPSSRHDFGKLAKEAVETAREKVADVINCFPDEVIFTSGATEAINLALKGFVEANSEKGNHIVTVKTEHKAVLATCEYLETKGIQVTYLDVDENGLISLEDLQRAVREETILISVMYVNNETGVIQPIQEIGRIAKENDLVFFCDATQAIGKVKVNVESDNIDLLAFSGHKINGPKGIGALYRRDGIDLVPLLHGGGQENGLRGGTYNTPLIVGLGKACEIAKTEFIHNNQVLISKREDLKRYFEENHIGKLNLRRVKCAPHILSISLMKFEADEYLMMKSKEFFASTGSACNASLIEQSHVLLAMGYTENNIIRISI